MSLKNQKHENDKPAFAQTNSLFYQFEHAERLKAEKEAKDRQKAQFAKKMAKFGNAEDNNSQSDNVVNQKAQMFVDLANADPEKERAELERKLEFERKMKGFQKGSATNYGDSKQLENSEVLKKSKIFSGENDDQTEKYNAEKDLEAEKRKQEFKEKSKKFNVQE